MFIRTRQVTLLSLALSLAACSAGGGTTPSAALNSADGSGGGHLVFQRLSIRPDAKSPATLINFVSDGPAQGGVPCIDCVSGASSGDNVGLTGPSSYVPTGSVWQYSLSFTDISYKGKCKLDWTITSGKKVVDSFSATVNLASAGGYVLYGINRKWPKYSGPATLTGKYTCGKDTQSTQAPLQFQ
jgi:hypothetical protein